jgi:hypothetical protein
MISITFGGLPISCYQDPKINYKIASKETKLLSGETYVSLAPIMSISPITASFPRSYECYTENFADITALVDVIGTFDTLIVSGVSYQNCYISGLSEIYEVSRGSGKWTYTIQFSRADQH